MSATFPTGVKSFTTKLAGDTVQASHANDLQDEVTAIETALVGGTLPAANGSALTNLNASNLASGTVPDARLSSTVGNVDATETVSAVWTFSAKPNINAGLQFPATQAASADANTFDDYEEGTWTVSDQSGAGLSLTSIQTARYVKKGQDVFVSGAITYPATANASNALLGTLPFTVAATAAGMVISYSDFGVGFTLQAAASGTTIIPWSLAGARITNASFSGKTIYFSGNYQASA